MWLQRNILNHKSVFCILLTLCLVSCSSRNGINRAFQKKYGEEMEKIIMERTAPVSRKDEGARLDFSAPRASVSGREKQSISSAYEQYYANVDEDEYRDTKPRKFYPDAAVHREGRNAPQSVPDNMFNIPYYTKLSPPFRKSGAEFDLIKIPKRDAYGVVTAMSEKKYPLVGNVSLQKNIDKVNAQRTLADIETSKMLIKEQKALRRREKMMKVFGRDYLTYDHEGKDDSEGVEDVKDNQEEVEKEKKVEVHDEVQTTNGEE